MNRMNPVLVALCACLLAASASAQIGGVGWVTKGLQFHVQWPTNAAEGARYFVTNSFYHMLVYSNDGAFEAGNTTLPRTEQRFDPDYTNGIIHYQATMMATTNSSSVCLFQIHTGDAQSDAFGSTTFMLFWFSANNGSVNDYSGSTLVTNLSGKWFTLNCDHNLNARIITVWVNAQEVWQQQDNGAGDFYFKDGVYEQDHNPTFEMDNYVTNILIWTNFTTNPFPGFYEIRNNKSALAACVRGMATTNGAAIVQSNFVSGANSLWYFVPTDSGYYRIMNVNSGLALAVQDAATSNNAPVVQWPYSTNRSGDWMPLHTTNSSGDYTGYSFTNRLSGKALDIASTSANQQLDQTNLTSSSYQQWFLIPYGSVASNRVFVPPLNCGVTNNHKLLMNLSGIPGATYLVQATTDLAPANWQPIFTNVADAFGNCTFTDTNTATRPTRYYRAVMP
jgi:hypothetical protein